LLPDTHLIAAAIRYGDSNLHSQSEKAGIVCSDSLTEQGPQQLGGCCRFCLQQLAACAAGQCAHQRLGAHVPAAYELLHLLGQQDGLGLKPQRVAEALQRRRQPLARCCCGSGRRGGGGRHLRLPQWSPPQNVSCCDVHQWVNQRRSRRTNSLNQARFKIIRRADEPLCTDKTVEIGGHS
jgi:hypothetical protein